MRWRAYVVVAAVLLGVLVWAGVPAGAAPVRGGWHQGGWGGWAWNGGYAPGYYGSSYYPWTYYTPSYYSSGVYGYGPYALGTPAAAGFTSYYYEPAGSVEDRSIMPVAYEEPGTEDAVHLRVRVPADAELFFDGQPTKQRGTEREFYSPPLTPGRDYTYDIKARWNDNGKTVERTRKVQVHADDWINIDMTSPEGGAADRNRGR
jgi:uncharacterized protein (TIGR03000 family)